MTNANMDMKVTVELAEEDRTRMDALIELLKVNNAIRTYAPYVPYTHPPYPTYRPTVWNSTDTNTAGVRDDS